jgi:hypothetical protein
MNEAEAINAGRECEASTVESPRREVVNVGVPVERLRADEQLAAEVLVSQLGGTIDPKDVGGAQATHDFDLLMTDGHRIAVEVTSATDEDMERLRGEARRRYPAPELRANWNVWLPRDPAELKLEPLMRDLARPTLEAPASRRIGAAL